MKRLIPLLILSLAVLSSCFLVQDDYTVNRHALIYSVDYGNDNENTLDNTVYDGIDMENAFTELGYVGTHRQNPTNTDILDDIAAHALIAGETDITLFYFSGHGYEDEGISYLVPYYDGGYDVISSQELYEALDAVDGQKIIILDICNSGGFVSSSGYDVDGLPEDYGTTLSPSAFFESWTRFFSQEDIALEFPDIHAISAAGRDELSYEHDTIQNGYYTYYLLETLGYDHETNTLDITEMFADSDGDGDVSISELYGNTFDHFSDHVTLPYYSHISGGPIDPILIQY